MWCKECNLETINERCESCGSKTEGTIPFEIFWCQRCQAPIIRAANSIDKNTCPSCGEDTKYLSADLRPVFPEERLLFEILIGKPLAFLNESVWSSTNRYYVNGNPTVINSSYYRKYTPEVIKSQLQKYSSQNSYDFFNIKIQNFIRVNQTHLNYVRDEAYSFIQSTSEKIPQENIVLSFSGGKDSTVMADLVIRALSNPCLVHIFGDTTLEFPITLDYVRRYRENNPKAIFKIAKNREQDFFKVCRDIGPPARMLRWCCSMFKTGPITRVLNNLYGNSDILTFYGIRKSESVSRSKYNRFEDNAELLKIQRQKVASPIFYWKDIDIWLYILSEGIDFNEAYRFGYDRVGCWCCPNNNLRAQFISQIYMPEQLNQWRSFLIDFARRIGKPDAETYVDTGKWKARQGGNGLQSANDVKIRYTNCTSEENAKVYRLNKPFDDNLIRLFTPFGKIAPELGRKLINETIVTDLKTKVPILSIQPFSQDGYNHAVKVKTMNVAKHSDLQRMVGYQIRKFNACRKCLKCESLCPYGAISITGDTYFISDKKCRRCRMCVTAKYLEGGCLMDRYLKTKE